MSKEVDRVAQGHKGAEVTRHRNFRHPSGERVVHDVYIRVTAHESEQIDSLADHLQMSAAGVVRMALYLFADDVEKMEELAAQYRAEVDE